MKLNKHFIIGAVAIQAVIIGVMIFLSWRPFASGTEFLMDVTPRDPRDMFRGQYVALDYRFNHLPPADLDNDFYEGDYFYAGDEFYLELDTIQLPEAVIREPIGIFMEKPSKDALYLKVELTRDFQFDPEMPRSRMNLAGGIEQYFTTPETADSLENEMRWDNRGKIRALASITVDRKGEARLTEVNIIPRLYPEEPEVRPRRGWWWWD